MLVLTRRLGEKLVIGDNVIVQVLQVQGDKVRLGIEAPQEVPVHRFEVAQRIEQSACSTELHLCAGRR